MNRTLSLLGCFLTCALVSAANPQQPSFSARRDYFEYGTYVVAADVNWDGIPDVIKSDGGYMQVSLGNGDGTFRSGPSTNTIMSGAATFVAADVNGDGKADLILAGGLKDAYPPWGVAVCFGNGDGTFQQGVFYQAGTDTEIYHLLLGDFNGDGIPDIAAAGTSGVWLFTGKGDGTYNPGVLSVPLAAGAGSLAAADLNGDGKLDLVVTMPLGSVPPYNGLGFAVLLGSGNGTFQAPFLFTKPIKSSAVAVADLNGDGHLDIALTSSFSAYISVYFGNGAGGFTGPSLVYLPGATDLKIADVNGDGFPDLVDPGVYIALGKGNGTFGKPIHYAVVTAEGTYNVALADLRNNGRTDIIMASPWAVSVLLNQGKGKYEDGKWIPVADGAGCGAPADYNGDGKPDLAVSTTGGVAILLGTGKAASPLTPGGTIALSGAECLVTGDVNGDGIADLLVPAPGATFVYLGKGDGTFTEKSSIPTVTADYLALADFNHDGKLDVATSGNLLALGNGDGTFQTPVPLVPDPPAIGGFSSIATADFNGDGWPDLVLGSAQNYPLYVLLNNQHGGFTESQATFGQGTLYIVPAKLNRGPTVDLVLAGWGDAKVYLGDGKGGFTYKTELIHPLGPYVGAVSCVAVADVNGDGIADVTVQESDSLAVFLGNGNGTFAAPLDIGVGPSPLALLVQNLHGQPASAGLPDFVVPDASGGVTVLINQTK